MSYTVPVKDMLFAMQELAGLSTVTSLPGMEDFGLDTAQAVLEESLSDEFDVESLLETDESLSWRRPELGLDVVRKLRRGVWALQGELDLHGLRVDEARSQLSLFLRDAQNRGLRCVRVVHGKGLGSPGRQPVLKDKVRRWLVQSDRVLAFVQARADEGGVGALVVLLKPGKTKGQVSY